MSEKGSKISNENAEKMVTFSAIGMHEHDVYRYLGLSLPGFIHLNSSKHGHLCCYYLERYNKEELFIFSTNNVAA